MVGEPSRIGKRGISDDVLYEADSVTLSDKNRSTLPNVKVAFHGVWLAVVDSDGGRSVYPSHLVESVDGISR